MEKNQFINRRREHRLPYFEKVIFTDGSKNLTAHAINFSSGGLFLTTLDAFPIDTGGMVTFMLSTHSRSLCIKARVAHVVYDRQRSEVECGMGLQFLEPTKEQLNLLNLQMLNDQRNYLELKELLKEEKPDVLAVKELKGKLPGLEHYDLLGLRYRVSRICTLFETPTVSNSSTAA